MKEFNAKKFLEKLYELSGSKEGAKVIVKEIKPKELQNGATEEKIAM